MGLFVCRECCLQAPGLALSVAHDNADILACMCWHTDRNTLEMLCSVMPHFVSDPDNVVLTVSGQIAGSAEKRMLIVGAGNAIDTLPRKRKGSHCAGTCQIRVLLQ